MWARLENNIVIEIINFDPTDKFTSDLVWVECDETAKEFMVFENGSFREPDTPVDIRPYNEKRVLEYPSIGDQLDMLWHAIDTGDWTPAKVKTTEFYTALKAVKDANPKP